MKEIILVKNGELVLKGLNRNSFEDVLIKNMKKHLAPLGKFIFTKSQSTIRFEPDLKRFSALPHSQEPPCAKKI